CALLGYGFVPVISPPVITADNEVINVDGDKIALHVAIELKATKLIFFVEAQGFLKDMNDESSVITSIGKTKIDSYLPYAHGRMKKKLLVSKWALENKIQAVHIMDGRINNPVTNA